MKEIAHEGWAEANQRYLMARLAVVRLALEQQAAIGQSSSGAEDDTDGDENTRNAQ